MGDIFSHFFVLGGIAIYKILHQIIFLIIISIVLISSIFIPTLNSYTNQNSIFQNNIILNPDGFIWPIPGYTKITSPFGRRNSPTAGASSYHYGTDIGAPEGTNLVAVADGKISFLGFLGAGGYTLTLSFESFKVTYCHISPNYLVKEGDIVLQGQVIAKVGPKYVYGVPGNKYKDSNGKPTNGATTGCHLHLGVRINDKYINPLECF